MTTVDSDTEKPGTVPEETSETLMEDYLSDVEELVEDSEEISMISESTEAAASAETATEAAPSAETATEAATSAETAESGHGENTPYLTDMLALPYNVLSKIYCLYFYSNETTGLHLINKVRESATEKLDLLAFLEAVEKKGIETNSGFPALKKNALRLARLEMSEPEVWVIQVSRSPQFSINVFKKKMNAVFKGDSRVLGIYYVGSNHPLDEVWVSMKTSEDWENAMDAFRKSKPGVFEKVKLLTGRSHISLVEKNSAYEDYQKEWKEINRLLSGVVEIQPVNVQAAIYNTLIEMRKSCPEMDRKALVREVLKSRSAYVSDESIEHEDWKDDAEFVAMVRRRNAVGKALGELRTMTDAMKQEMILFDQLIEEMYNKGEDLSTQSILKAVFYAFPEININPKGRMEFKPPDDISLKWVLLQNLPPSMKEKELRMCLQERGDVERLILLGGNTTKVSAVVKFRSRKQLILVIKQLRSKGMPGETEKLKILRYTGKLSSKTHEYNKNDPDYGRAYKRLAPEGLHNLVKKKKPNKTNGQDEEKELDSGQVTATRSYKRNEQNNVSSKHQTSPSRSEGSNLGNAQVKGRPSTGATFSGKKTQMGKPQQPQQRRPQQQRPQSGSQNKEVILWNLPPGTTEEQVHISMSEFGIVERIEMRISGKSCVVHMKTEQQAKRAAEEYNGKMVPGCSNPINAKVRKMKESTPTRIREESMMKGQRPRGEVSLWNLPPGTTEEQVRISMTEFGIVEHIEMRTSGTSCVVHMKTAQQAERAAEEYSGKMLPGCSDPIWSKFRLVKESTQATNTGRGGVSGMRAQPPQRELDLWNMPGGTTEEQVNISMSEFGIVEEIEISRSGKSCMVRMKTAQQARKAADEYNGKIVPGSSVPISAKLRGSAESTHTRREEERHLKAQQRHRVNQNTHPTSMNEPNRELGLWNMPLGTTDEDVHISMSEFGVVEHVDINQSGTSCVVRMKTSQQAERAVEEYNGIMVPGCSIPITAKLKVSRDSTPIRKDEEPYHQRVNQDKQPTSAREENRKLDLWNLPPNTNIEQIHISMSEFGIVEHIEISPTGSACTVRMGTALQAREAADEYNGKIVPGSSLPIKAKLRGSVAPAPTYTQREEFNMKVPQPQVSNQREFEMWNLPPGTTEEEVLFSMSDFGIVEHIDMSRSGISCMIRMQTAQQAERAAQEYNGKMLPGCSVPISTQVCRPTGSGYIQKEEPLIGQQSTAANEVNLDTDRMKKMLLAISSTVAQNLKMQKSKRQQDTYSHRSPGQGY